MERIDALRIEIRAMTASFRYPMFVVSYQPTYKVPPVSTIYGLLSAAKGEKVSIWDLAVGYSFTHKGMGIDLEKLWEFGGEEKNRPAMRLGSNIVQREFLYDCMLTLYISDIGFKKYLKNPRYTLLLGRQSDLAKITKIKEVKLIKKQNIEISNTVMPFNGETAGQIMSLPSDYTDSAERKPIEVRTYCIVESKQKIKTGYYDVELDRGVYLHEFVNKGKK